MFSRNCIKLFLVCLVAVLADQSNAAVKSSRILGGHKISVEQAPYIVQLRDKDGFFCGGALVHPRFVVTAAHCLEGMQLPKITVVGGATTIHDKGVESQIEDGFMPSEYDPDTIDMDVAVLKLKTPIKGGIIQTVPLCSRTLKKGDKLQVSGWGRTHERGTISEDLRTVSVPLLGQDDCIAKYKKKNEKITASMMCAHEPGSKDACTSDSGGPAIVGRELCGVVSWGLGCGRPDSPGVYTNINEVKWFIEQVIEDAA